LVATSTPELVEQFKSVASNVVAVVYEAESAEDANNYVVKLAQEHNVKGSTSISVKIMTLLLWS